MNFYDIDLNKLYLINDRKGYRISYDMTKLIIKTPIIEIPFGIELYNNKEIVNILTKNDNNDNHNFINFLKRIEKIFINSNNKNINFKNDIIDKKYISTVKKSNQNILLRTHCKNTDIYTIIDNKKIPVEKKLLNNKKCICDIELSNIWFYGDNYGIMWSLLNVNILE